MEEHRRKLVHETVEVPSKGKMGERSRQVVHRVIKRDPEGEPGESGGEIIHALVEAESEGELRERWKVDKCCIEGIIEGDGLGGCRHD